LSVNIFLKQNNVFCEEQMNYLKHKTHNLTPMFTAVFYLLLSCTTAWPSSSVDSFSGIQSDVTHVATVEIVSKQKRVPGQRRIIGIMAGRTVRL